jgi:tRNA dimethylallyltransferase
MLDACHDQPQARELQHLHAMGVIATRQLAKRQLTWLRSMPQRQIVACDAADPTTDVLALVHNRLQQSPD